MARSDQSFQPGDAVVWRKHEPSARDSVVPVAAVVLGVTPKRVKIETNDPEGAGIVIRHVAPTSLTHAAAPGAPEPATAPKPGKHAPDQQPGRPATLRLDRVRKPVPDAEIEERILMEIVADANDEEERAMGWYYYLDDRLGEPFRAECVEEREVSPLSIGEEVEVVGMAAESECSAEMFARIRWGKRTLAVPLAQLAVVEADGATRQAVEDWHYWVAQGYQL